MGGLFTRCYTTEDGGQWGDLHVDSAGVIVISTDGLCRGEHGDARDCDVLEDGIHLRCDSHALVHTFIG